MVKNDKSVIAVVVTYNRKDILKECIEALLNQSYAKLKILIIDNASTDNTKEEIKKYVDNKKVFYKNTEKNIGGAGGFNFGIKEAYKLGSEFVWLMDDDSIVQKNTLKELIAADKKLNGNYGFLSSKVLWKDKSLCKMNIQRISLFSECKDFNSELVNIQLGSFVSMFIPMSIVKKVGLPIKEFFIWGDDWEYSRRISRKYNCYLANKSIVNHKCKLNMGGNIVIDDYDRLWRYNYAFRNDAYWYKREGFKGILYIFLRQFYYLIKIIFSKANHKFKRIGIVFSKTFKGLFFNPIIDFLDKENKHE